MPFTWSTAACRREYNGATLRMMKNSAAPRTGVHTKNTSESCAFIQKESPTPSTSITGPRTMGRKPLLIAFCNTVTSVVIRVTSEEVSKWSRLENAYCCTLAYSASRMRAPSP